MINLSNLIHTLSYHKNLINNTNSSRNNYYPHTNLQYYFMLKYIFEIIVILQLHKTRGRFLTTPEFFIYTT